jgi:hypothetical protein
MTMAVLRRRVEDAGIPDGDVMGVVERCSLVYTVALVMEDRPESAVVFDLGVSRTVAHRVIELAREAGWLPSSGMSATEERRWMTEQRLPSAE